MSKTGVILLVNSNRRNLQLLSEFLGKEGFPTVPIQDYASLDQAMDGKQTLVGALVDIAGFDGRIWQRCEQLRAARIPFLVISPRLSAAIQQASLSHGARGVMVKPLVLKELLSIIKALVEEE